ncbi:hypothetical protein J3Q64DRAFT_1324039 [Phycomyces blakesleeanus]|uniref:Borealin N-terminal domain-containing protein n=1 Tax=Phycomyces blakesleeanus TaxID=4837 RepID=A0ABR3B7K9_PHYBL
MLPLNSGQNSLWSPPLSQPTLHNGTTIPDSTRLSLAELTVGDILEQYKYDADLLKCILIAKAEEDKRRTAEEVRRAEETNLRAKYIDLELVHMRRASDSPSLIDDFISGSFGSLGVSSEFLPEWPSIQSSQTMSVMSPVVNSLMEHPYEKSPSPTQCLTIQPHSPGTAFEVPFAGLSISTSSSPEPTEVVTVQKNTETAESTEPPPVVALSPPKERSCKRTLSRTRSQRRPGMSVKTSKKNRSATAQPLPQPLPQPPREVEVEEKQLDHGAVMEALRAKIRRSVPSQEELELQATSDQLASMSQTGVLLLDLKNPRKLFPVRRTPASPRVPVARRPRPFTSAHNHVEKLKEEGPINPTPSCKN